MNICEKEHKNPELIGGHLYSKVGFIRAAERDIYIYAPKVNTLFCIKDGIAWSTNRGFDSPGIWEDVTDQYCLTKV